eukprot:1004554-Prymnesium_polylepis.1
MLILKVRWRVQHSLASRGVAWADLERFLRGLEPETLHGLVGLEPASFWPRLHEVLVGKACRAPHDRTHAAQDRPIGRLTPRRIHPRMGASSAFALCSARLSLRSVFGPPSRWVRSPLAGARPAAAAARAPARRG